MKRRKIAKAAVAVLSVMTIGASGAALAACGKKEHVHSYGEWKIDVTPTLTSGGTAKRDCVNNDYTDTVNLPALNDTTFWTEDTGAAVAATHLEDGSRKFDSKTYVLTVTIVVPKGAHNQDSWKITKEPTLTEKGKAEYTCNTDSYKQEIEIPALSDTSVWTKKAKEHVDPTHTANGKDVYSSKYGEVTVVLPADADAHTWGAWAFVEGKTPTLTAVGEIQRVCGEGENAHVDKKEVPALSDSEFWTRQVVTAATHHSTGVAKYVNTEYNLEVGGVVIEKDPNHTFGDWVLTEEPTLDGKGSAERKCTEDDCAEDPTAVDTVEVPALSDTTVWQVKEHVAPTHTKEGKDVYTSVYGEVTVVLPASADAHTWGDWAFVEGKTPSLTAGGEIQRVCEEVNSHVDKKEVPALSDSDFWTYEVVTAATHQTEGVAKYVNEEYNLEVGGFVIEKVAHTYGAWVMTTEPTLNDKGVATRRCTADECANDATAVQTQPIPELSDTTEWTAGTPVEPDYNHPGSITYTSKNYGSVTIITAPKLVAPYDGKSYISARMEVNDNGKASAWVWNTGLFEVDENGVGVGTGYPFRGTFTFEFVDTATGYILIKPETGTNMVAYVDKATGVIVMSEDGTWNNPFVMIPSDSDSEIVNSDFAVATCAGDFVINYTKDTTVYNILIADGVAYFGISVANLSGALEISADLFSANPTAAESLILVKDSSGKVVKSYGYKYDAATPRWVDADGLEGVYVLEDGRKLLVNGAGSAMVLASSGETEKGGFYSDLIISNTAESRIIGIIVDNVYYEYALSGDGLSADGGSCTETMPKSVITLNFGEYKPDNYDALEVTSPEVSRYVLVEITVPTHSDMQFMGWYYDAALTQAVELVDNAFAPRAAEVTLYAKWALKVAIHLNNLLEGDEEYATLYVGEGDIIGEHLTIYTKYQVDTATNKYFEGWYLDANFEEALDLSAEISAGDTGLELYAKWVEVPAYYGEYSGRQLLSGDTYYEANISIDVVGNITGLVRVGAVTTLTIDGKVNDEYDAATQVLYWTPNGDHGKSYMLWYDNESGLLVIADELSKTEMDNYPSVLSKNSEVGYNVSINYALSGVKMGKTKIVKYGDKLALLFNNKIYGDVSLFSAFGDELEIEYASSYYTVNSNTLVVKQGESVVLAIGTNDTKITSGDIVALDGHYGKFTVGDVDYSLDGMGNISWNDKEGRYELISASDGEKVFGVFELSEGLEVAYHELTLGATNSIVTPEAVLTYSYNGTTETVSINKKIVYTLKVLADTETHLFRGWTRSEDSTGDVLKSIIIESDTTVYAKWVEKVTVTLNSNRADVELTVTSVTAGKGETVEIENPTSDKYLFVGWYTTADYQAGTEWISGKTVVNGDIELYAKWEVPAYMHTYGVIFMTGTSTNGGVTGYTAKTGTFTLGPDGQATQTSVPYPFAQDLDKFKVIDYNKETGTIGLFLQWDYNYYGYIDNNTGIMVINANYGQPTNAWTSTVYFLSPYGVPAASEFSSSYWNGGKTRLITYTHGETSHNIFIYDGVVYFDVTFADAKSGGSAVVAGSAYNTKTSPVYVIKDGTVIAGFAHNGTTMQLVDGNEGTYSGEFNGTSVNLVVDGVGKLTLGDVKVSYEIVDGRLAFYHNNAYYEITLNKVVNQYVCVQPMVTISFNVNGGTAIEPVRANKNIAFDMPANPTREGYVFRGWYLDSALTNEASIVNGKYTSAEDMTFYAKWDALVTLTVVYGQGLADAKLVYGAGDTTEPIRPLHTNGKVFEKWVTIVDDEEVDYTPGAITENTTIYAKWYEEASEFTGDYRGVSFTNTYSDGTGQLKTTTVPGAFVIDVDGKIANISTVGNYAGTIEWVNKAEGRVLITSNNKTYHGFYDETHGIIVMSNSEGDSSKSFEYAMSIYFLNATSVPNANTVVGSFMNGYSRIFTVDLGGRNDGTVTILIHDGKAYYNPTFKSSNEAEQLTAANIYNTVTDKVYFYAEGDTEQANPIAIFKKSDNKLLPYDGLDQNTYVDTNGNEVKFDGTGTKVTFTYNGVQKSLKYVKAAAGEGYDYLAYNSSNKGDYFEITITGNVCTIVNPSATLVFHSNEGTDIPSVEVAIYDRINLGSTGVYVPERLGYLFDGWYTDEELTKSAGWLDITKKGEIHLYAKWTEGWIITTHVGDVVTKTTVKKGITVRLSNGTNSSYYYLNYPVLEDGKDFRGWYTNEACTEIYSGGVANDHIELWAKVVLSDAKIDYGTASYPFTMTYEDGNYIWKSGNKNQRSSTSTLTITAGAAGVLKFDYNVSSEANNDKLTIVKGSQTLVTISGQNNSYQSIEIILAAGDVVKITYSKDSSSDYGDDTAYIRNIVFATFDSSLAGDYSCAGQENIHLDGEMTITWDGKTGTYLPMEGEDTFDVYFLTDGVKTEHYTLVINRSGKTYTLIENKVTITFDMGGTGEQVAPVSVWTGVVYDSLPVATDSTGEMTFVGWFSDAEFKNKVTSIVPSEDITLYARWADGVVITYVAGNYGFVYDETHDFYASNNQGKDSSSAVMKIEILKDGLLTFKYQASSEADSKWDWLKIEVNGTQVANAGGKETAVTGGVPDTWFDFERAVKAGDVITITYVKDSGGKGGEDTAWIKDIVYAKGGQVQESKFSGKTFADSSDRSIVFNKGSAISAKFETYGMSWTFGSGSYDETSNKLTLNITAQTGNYAEVGDYLVFTYNEAAGTLTLVLSESSIHPTGSLDSAEYGFTDGQVYTLKA